MLEVSDRPVVRLEGNVGISSIYPACVTMRSMARKVCIHPELYLSNTCIAGIIRGEIGGEIRSDSRVEKRCLC